mmetsp:Transcript_53491/g.153511  ORF Transcript_53491/g.153511 Transcript_53491/m.153511 type:complete len:523 (+) Transcript_53491:148-1716(+)
MLSCLEGEDVGPYQVLQMLGRGSFGLVLLAEDPRRPQQRFALKLVPCDHLDADAAARARSAALGEAELLMRLRHPNVVTCHEVRWDSVRRVVWFALDFMDGGDLQSLIEHRKRSAEQPPEAAFVRRVMSAIGSALRYIHSQGVLHRDVKSSNVLLARDGSGAGVGEIKLADFGISKLLEVTNQAHTVVGTPPYMSPELVRGEPYGTASDAWAFGVMIFELATLRRPFDAGNQLALVRQIVDQQPAPLPVGVAPDIAKAIHGLLEKDPQKRLHIGEVLAMSSALRGMVPLPPPPSFPPPASPFLAVARGYDASGMGSTEEVDVLTLLDDLPGPGRGGLTAGLGSGDAYRESTIDVLMLHAGGSGGVGEFAQPVHDEPAQDWAMGAALSTEELPALPSLGTSRAQAVGLSPRPGYAFSNPEEELQKAAAKEKQWGGGRRWLPRFGMALRGGVSKADRDATVISAFGSEPSDDSDEGGAGASGHGSHVGSHGAGGHGVGETSNIGTPQASPRTKWAGSMLSSPPR